MFSVPAELFGTAVLDADLAHPTETETLEMREIIELLAGKLPLPDLSGSHFSVSSTPSPRATSLSPKPPPLHTAT